ncbi:MAG: prolipoprotein diacylglyceryl transferase [Alphaproteobacteria bacterium]|nr:prolipoprotein diacylglyceryl transferase [Alphaproteobacteria bacterium]
MPLLEIQFPAINPIAFHIGPAPIRWYALAYISGILLGWIYARALIRKAALWDRSAPMTLRQLEDFIFWVTLGIILGGRLGDVLWELPRYIADPVRIIQLWNGGMAFHGGYVGCVVAVMWFAWRNRISILSLGDLTTAVAPMGLFLGRMANFINSELWGRAADPGLPWAMRFPTDPEHLLRHPSQLYEAGLEGILLFGVLAVLIRLGALKRPGLILGSFTLLYGMARIVAEFFRDPDPPYGEMWNCLTMGMLLSIPMVIAGFILILMAARRHPQSSPMEGG